jgi:predicted nuclease of predicted toxin-antitoxin system
MPANENPLKLFLDENLPKNLWKALRAVGYSAARAVDEGLRGKHDSAIFRQLRHRSIIITRDKDFLRPDLFPPPHSGIIVIDLPGGTPVPDLIRTVVNALSILSSQELTNKVYIVELDQVRERA